MLEFLKGFEEFHISDRAVDCEQKLGLFDCITPMAVLAEAILKSMYWELYHDVSEKEVSKKSLNRLLEDKSFVEDMEYEFKVSKRDIEVLNLYVRKTSNEFKHNSRIEPISDDFKRDCFKSIFNLSTCYYNTFTGNHAPEWNLNEYKKLADVERKDRERIKREKELKAEIDKLTRRVKEERKARTTANEEIEKLSEELALLINNETSSHDSDKIKKKLEELEKVASQKQSECVLLKEKERAAVQAKLTLEDKLQELKQLHDADSRETKKIIQRLEKDYQSATKEISELRRGYEKLNELLQSVITEKDKYKEKLIESNKSEAHLNLEAKIKKAETDKLAANDTIASLNAEIENLRSQLNAFSEYDRVVKSALRKKVKQVEADTMLANLEHKYAPICSVCGRTMKIRFSKKNHYPYWGCPGYYEPEKCENMLYLSVTKELEKIYKSIIGKDTVEEYRLESQDSKIVNGLDTIYYPYPESFGKVKPTSYLFQSVQVPKPVFDERETNYIEMFSKFEARFALKKNPVKPAEHTIYSMALRILNRGTVLPEYTPTKIALEDVFNKSDTGAINWLFDYIEYVSPVNLYDSPRERAFAEYYMPRLLGQQWATYVFTQVALDALLAAEDDLEMGFYNQRVDFLICKNGRKVVVELDGPEHSDKAKQDALRDEVLRNHGYKVLRFKNPDVDNREEFIYDNLLRTIGISKNPRVDANVDNRYLVATKLSHQIAITIVKALEQGYIERTSNLKIYVDTKLLTRSECDYVLNVAKAEVYAILKNYAIIYGLEDLWNFSDESKPEIAISVGDGKRSTNGGIIIRDCVLPYSFLCAIDEYDSTIVPVNADYQALSFFNSYLFDYKDFRGKQKGGQYKAIERLLLKKDTIVLLPTGTGKSAVYQLASFMVPGIITVISPLVSLMEDQVSNLELKFGIKNAIYFASVVTEDDERRRIDNLRLMQHNSTSLIYISPERLQVPTFRTNVKNLLIKNNVFGVAIDEAHCVSEWGHDFRPAYLNVGNAARRIFEKNGNAPVIAALTGTASEAVLNDIRTDLDIRKPEALIQPDTFDRPELHFSIVECDAYAKDSGVIGLVKSFIPKKFETSFEGLAKLKGSETDAGIIFTPNAYSKSGSLYAAGNLRGVIEDRLVGMRIGSYFSKVPEGFDEKDWKRIIRNYARDFKDNKLNMLVSTKAYGMGIDKGNVHFVIHSGIPSSFEQYYQEAGRAGRDGKNSQCVLLFSDSNTERNQMLLSGGLDIDTFKYEYDLYNTEVYENNTQDDVSTLLYFHNKTFEGIEVECEQIMKAFDKVSSRGFITNRNVAFMIPLKLEKGKNEKREYNEKPWIQAIIRLITLGVVTDYTYDYNGKFTVTCGSIEKEAIASAYGAYVGDGRAKEERAKILGCTDSGRALVEKAVTVLVQYIYDYIEKSRRKAIYDMYDAAQKALTFDEDKQEAYIRKRITSYFQYSGENRNDLRLIEEGKNAGLEILPQALHLETDRPEYTDEERTRASETYILAGRLLESKPDHPGLLIAETIGRLISLEFDSIVIKNTITSAIRFAKERYSVEDIVIKPVIYRTLNEVLNNSENLFDECVEAVSSEFGEKTYDILEQLAKSEEISDAYRTYVLASYMYEKLSSR